MINIIIASEEKIKPEEIRQKKHLTFGACTGRVTFTKIADIVTSGLFTQWGSKITNLTETENKIINGLMRNSSYFCESKKLYYLLVEQKFKVAEWQVY